MGQSGCGKTTFINSAAGGDIIKVNMSLKSCLTIEHAICSHPASSKRFALVETPGFNNTASKPASKILAEIAEWMKKAGWGNVEFGGLLYLQQVDEDKPMLTSLLGNDLIKKNLLHVVTFPNPPSGGRRGSEPRVVEFPHIRKLAHPERKAPAWKVINEVSGQIGTKKVTVADFLEELYKIPGVADAGKKGAGAFSRFARFFG